MVLSIATKFVSCDVNIKDVHEFKGSKVYEIRAKLNRGENLSREEKNWITKNVNSNSYFRKAIPLLGWKFDFSDVLRTFLVKQYGRWEEYSAIDKTSLREYICGKIDMIVSL